MTLLDRTPTDTFHEGSTPVLETERLCLRAPRLEDAKQVAALVNDRRIAENTARIPHPYAITDAREWIGAANNYRCAVNDQLVNTGRSPARVGVCHSVETETSPELP